MSLLLDALRRAGTARNEATGDAGVSRGRAGTGSRAAGHPLPDLDEPEPLNETDTAKGAAPPGGAQADGRARAEAVFRGAGAGTPSGHPALRLAGLTALTVALLVGAIAVGGWYYYQQTRDAVDRSLVRYTPEPEPGPRTSDGARPVPDSAADAPAGTDGGAPSDGGDMATTTEEPSPSAPASGDAGTATASAEDGRADDAATRTGTTGADGEAARSPDAVPEERAADGAGSSGAGGDTSQDDGAAREATRSGSGGAASAAGDGAAAVGGDGAVADEMVRHVGKRGSALTEALRGGYRALRGGDLDAAGRDYARALELAPSNRDALLGAAAVAQRRGDTATAIDRYRAVLRDHPRDPWAMAGLSSLGEGGDSRRSESELKSLIRRKPDAHALQFALGNLYAREGRWSDAQSAYFEAFRAAPKEADYAFNLAVALDHLGQRDAARKYYGRALALVGDGGASFDTEAARSRLKRLQP